MHSGALVRLQSSFCMGNPNPDSAIFSFFQDDVLLHCQPFHLVAKGADLRIQVGSLVRSEGNSNDGPRDTAGAADGDLAGKEDIRDVLLLGEKRKVEDDAERLRVGGENDEFAGATRDPENC